jgi:hypothetical protein
LSTARMPTTATAASCRATSSAFMALSAALQALHCATCDQYLRARARRSEDHSAVPSFRLQRRLKKRNGT